MLRDLFVILEKWFIRIRDKGFSVIPDLEKEMREECIVKLNSFGLRLQIESQAFMSQ